VRVSSSSVRSSVRHPATVANLHPGEPAKTTAADRCRLCFRTNPRYCNHSPSLIRNPDAWRANRHRACQSHGHTGPHGVFPVGVDTGDSLAYRPAVDTPSERTFPPEVSPYRIAGAQPDFESIAGRDDIQTAQERLLDQLRLAARRAAHRAAAMAGRTRLDRSYLGLRVRSCARRRKLFPIFKEHSL